MKKSEDFTSDLIKSLNKENGSRVAVEFESFRNYLCQLSTVSLCGSIPSDQVNIINDFILTAGAVKIVQGHSTGKSALVLFYHVHMCVQCEVLVIWLLHLSLHCIHLLALATYMY